MYPKDFTREYLKSRDKMSLVIKYLEKILEQPPNKEVTNDCIRLIIESMKTQSELYIDLNKLPKYNVELRLENHLLKVENKKLQADLDMALKIKF